MPRIVAELLDQAVHLVGQVTFSYIQIHNDNIIDVLKDQIVQRSAAPQQQWNRGRGELDSCNIALQLNDPVQLGRRSLYTDPRLDVER